MQAHGFEQHLVAIGRTVKSASAFAVVGGRLGLQQLGAAHQPQRGLLAYLGFFFVGQARSHGSGRHKHGGQMPKVQCAYQEARNNLVAHAQHQGAVKHVVAERHRSGHGNRVAGKQAELHAGCALGHAVTHRGHATGDLRGSAPLAGFVFDDVGVMLQGRMGREHVVVSVDDGDIGRAMPDHLHFVQGAGAALVGRLHGGKGMRHIGAAHALGARRSLGHGIDLGQVSAAGGCAAGDDAVGDGLDTGMDWHGGWCNQYM